jgi:hypothetical protein
MRHGRLTSPTITALGLSLLAALLLTAASAQASDTTSLKYKNKTKATLVIEAQIGGVMTETRVRSGKAVVFQAVDNGSCAHVRLAKDTKTKHKCHDLGTPVKGACDMPHSFICLSRVTFPAGQLRITVFPEGKK